MTQKLKILGSYTPEHKGPFCTREGKPVEVKIRDGRGCYAVYGYIGDEQSISAWTADGRIIYDSKRPSPHDLMNAEEVPQPREFWMAFSTSGGRITCRSPEEAHQVFAPEYRKEVIHVREVLPGEGE